MIDSEDVTGRAVAERIARGLAIVPENRRLFGQLTVLENLELGATLPQAIDPLAQRVEATEVGDARERRHAQRASAVATGAPACGARSSTARSPTARAPTAPSPGMSTSGSNCSVAK